MKELIKCEFYSPGKINLKKGPNPVCMWTSIYIVHVVMHMHVCIPFSEVRQTSGKILSNLFCCILFETFPVYLYVRVLIGGIRIGVKGISSGHVIILVVF